MAACAAPGIPWWAPWAAAGGVPLLVTQTRRPSAVAWTLWAPAPTVMVRTVWRVSVAITLTVPSVSLAT